MWSQTIKTYFSLSGEKPFLCEAQGCGRSFAEYSSLRKHLVVHSGKRLHLICCDLTEKITSLSDFDLTSLRTMLCFLQNFWLCFLTASFVVPAARSLTFVPKCYVSKFKLHFFKFIFKVFLRCHELEYLFHNCHFLIWKRESSTALHSSKPFSLFWVNFYHG